MTCLKNKRTDVTQSVTESSPFTFSPQGGRVECSAFTQPFKALAMLLVSLVVIWGWRMWVAGQIETNWRSSSWLLATLAMMAYTEWHIFKGKTSLDSTALQQSWMWDKRVDLRDLAFAKLFRIRGLEWLIAPRLYTKTFSGKLAAFYAAGPDMLAEFQRLELALNARRAQR
jgi:hypothetical protein